MRVELAHGCFIKVAACYAGLVGDDDYVVTGLVEQTHRFRCADNPFKLLGSVDIAVVDIKHAVAIEKRRRTLALIDVQDFNSVFLKKRICLYKQAAVTPAKRSG